MQLTIIKMGPVLIKEWLENLQSSSKPIIVEGKRDKQALLNIGIQKSRIITLNKPLFEISEQTAKKTNKVIILTDLDKEGKKLYKKLKTELSTLGVEIDNKFREFLFKHTKISHIEGIDTYINNNTQL